jgi:hypothetical protein
MDQLIDTLGAIATNVSVPEDLRVASGAPCDRQDTTRETASAHQEDTSRIRHLSSSSAAVVECGDARHARRRMVLIAVGIAACAIILSSGYVAYRLASRRESIANNVAIDADRSVPHPPDVDDSSHERHERSVAAGTVAWPGAPKAMTADVDREVAQRVFSLGGSVTIVADFRTRSVSRVEDLPSGPFSISGFKVTNSGFGNADLAIVGKLRRLETLELIGCDTVTDDGLRSLEDMTCLQRFVLKDAPVTSAGLAHLIHNQGLSSISLDGPQIDDDAIEFLKRFPALAGVQLTSPEFSGARLAELVGLAELRHLGINGDVLSARIAEALAEFPALEHLVIVGSSGDDYLQHAAGLTGVDLTRLRRGL